MRLHFCARHVWEMLRLLNSEMLRLPVSEMLRLPDSDQIAHRRIALLSASPPHIVSLAHDPVQLDRFRRDSLKQYNQDIALQPKAECFTWTTLVAGPVQSQLLLASRKLCVKQHFRLKALFFGRCVRLCRHEDEP